MALVALAGTVPLMSFVAERSVTREVRSRLTAPVRQEIGVHPDRHWRDAS
jgi:hypothetical protein